MMDEPSEARATVPAPGSEVSGAWGPPRWTPPAEPPRPPMTPAWNPAPSLPPLAGRWTAAASWAVGLLVVYASLILIQATLAFLAEIVEFRQLTRGVVRIIGTVILIAGLVQRRRWAWWAATFFTGPVSYTHLTLPTICSV